MANLTNKKFGVVHTSPSNLITNAASLEDGKLYFVAGDASGLVKQGIYGVVGVTTDGSIDIDGNGSGKQLAMFGTGAVADGTGYGLSQANFTTDEKNKLAGIAANANNYSLPLAATNTRGGIQVGFTAKDASIPVLLSGEDAYVQLTKTSIEKGLGYTINASVPSDAKFTDTDTWRAINVNGKQQIANNVSTALDISAGNNIEVSFDNNKVVIAAKNVDASNADHATNADNASTADKVKSSLTIKGSGTTVGTFNGSTAEEVNIKSGSASTLTVTGAADGSITITPVTAAVASNSNALTTGAQVASYVSAQLGDLTGALLYQGTVSNATELNSKAKTQGHVWISSSKDWEYTDVNNQKYKIEVGDMFICNGTGWNIVSSEFDVSTYDNTLSWETDVSIAVVDGVTITAKLPENPNTDYQATKAGHYTPEDKDASVAATANGSVAWSGAVVTGVTKDDKGHITGVTTSTIPSNPNTDEKVKDSSGTAKSFILGHASQGSTAAAITNASVYMHYGRMYAMSGSIASNDTALVNGGTVYAAVEAAKEAATIYWETL